MDYMEQVEKLYKYFEYNLDLNLMRSLIELKHNYNNDLNLVGCYLKDFLIIKSGKKIKSDNDLYDEFVLYIEEESNRLPSEYIINELIKFSKYYISIVFEDFTDSNILIAVSTINSCFALEYYPIIMKTLDRYYSGALTPKKFKIMLDSIVDVAIKNFEESDILEILPDELESQVKTAAKHKYFSVERTLV